MPKKSILKGVALTVFFLIVALILVATYTEQAGTRSPTTPRERPPSVVYQVFEPAIVGTNNLIEFFRPSNLKIVGCTAVLPIAQRWPFEWLTSLANRC